MKQYTALEADMPPPEAREVPPALDVAYLTGVFRDAKKFDEASGGKDDPTPWQQRYAAYVTERLQQTLNGAVPEFLTKERLPEFLEKTEYTHNADWPEHFAFILKDYLDGRVHDVSVSEFADSPELADLRKRLDRFYLDLAQNGEPAANQDILVFANTLKAAKSAHMRHQEEQGTPIPWAEWYAGYLEDALRERFGKNGQLTKEVIRELLEKAEEMHTAEWPATYATAVEDELRGVNLITPQEQEELGALQKIAEEAGRVEKIPDDAVRRRYLALNLKRMRGNGARSEIRDSAARQKAENLSPEELEERERHMEVVRHWVDAWVEREGITEKYLSKEQLAELVRFLHETPECREAIYAVTNKFADREKYLQRPAVLVYVAGHGRMNIDLYLLGWRCPEEGWKEGPEAEAEGVPRYLADPEGTYIHDHEAAEVGIQVLEYDPVTEVLYSTEQTQTAGNAPLERAYFDPRLPEDIRAYRYTKVERKFDAGSNLQVGAPYIHQFRGPQSPGEHGMAATMHAYAVDPEAIPTDLTPEISARKIRRGGCYKMNYFIQVSDPATGEKLLKHVGFYTMLEPQDENDPDKFYMEGVVEGVTSPKQLPEHKGRWMFC